MTKSEQIERLRLMKRTAWRNMQFRTANAEEVATYTPILNKIVEVVALIDSILLDLETAMTTAGVLRHGNKRTMNAIEEQARQMHGRFYDVINGRSPEDARRYNEAYSTIEAELADAVLIEDPITRYYSILTALCRIAIDLNNTRMGRFKLPTMVIVANIYRALRRLPFEDKNIDVIVRAVVMRPRAAILKD